MSIARRIVIRGRVQGVYFRDSMCTEADQLDVTGWVRNRGDGSVEAWAQGSKEAVEAIIDWAHRGPAQARVDAVECQDVEPDPGLRDFSRRPSA